MTQEEPLHTIPSTALRERLRQLPWRTILLVSAFFIIVAIGFFGSAHFEGRELFQMDVAGASGNGSDVRESGEKSYWTNSLFGGMPMYQISPSYPSTKPLQYIENLLTLRKPLNILGTYPWLIFALLGGFYLFMRALRVKPLPSVLGSVMWAFSSYFIILIQAGHIWKLTTLCFVPPVVAGLIWTYQGKRLLGGTVFSLFMALQIMSNHVQMSYYFAILMIILVIGYLVQAIREKQLTAFFRSTAVLFVAGILSIAVNGSNLYHTYQYAQETMRGGSELTIAPPHAEQASSSGSSVSSSGLSKDYITQWSYGIGETWTLLVPNTKGGETQALAERHARQVLKAPVQYQSMLSQMNAYWGDQPFTSGPVYVGAFVVLLFLVGCVVVGGPIKWGLLIATILSILLSWGKNFMPLTDMFIDWVPMYDKFRAVSSILVIAEFTIPALAVLGLVEIVRRPDHLRDRKVWIVSAIPVLALLLFAVMPDLFFSFLSQQEQTMFAQMAAQDPAYLSLQDSLERVRQSIFIADVWRSLVVILLSLVPVWLFAKKYIKAPVLYIALIAITLVDLWSVDKRYLSDADFKSHGSVQAQAAPRTAADEQILQDKEPGYRVFNATVNSFNDATTSRWHHSVGGYHAAKLQRYQDLIEHQLSVGNQQVFDMLNTKYFIVPDQQTHQPQAMFNPGAFGAAWFVDQILWVENADQEMAALSTSDLRHTAIVDKRFADDLPASITPADSTQTQSIRLTQYTPSTVTYQINAQQPGVVVLSDIYYPHGWRAMLDDQEIPIARANYVLRSVAVPAGQHQLQLSFHPSSVQTTETIAFIALGIILLSCVLLLLSPFLRREKNALTPSQTSSQE